MGSCGPVMTPRLAGVAEDDFGFGAEREGAHLLQKKKGLFRGGFPVINVITGSR
jgi:hypothetical protein